MWGKAVRPIWKKAVRSVASCFSFSWWNGTRALSDWDCHPSPAVPFHTGPYTPRPLSALLPSTIHSFPLTEMQKGPMFSAMCWLIVTPLSVYPNNMAKRWHPERVLACSLHFTRNEREVHVNCPVHRKCDSKNESSWLFNLICPMTSLSGEFPLSNRDNVKSWWNEVSSGLNICF